MITSERDWKHRMTVYSVRCDGCSYERKVDVYDRISGDDGPIREEDLRKQGGVSWVDGKWDLCAACDACDPRVDRSVGGVPGSIYSSWDVRDGEVRETTMASEQQMADLQRASERLKRQSERLFGASRSGPNRKERRAHLQPNYERDRLRAAMAGMANVMHGVAIALDHLNDAFENMRDDNELRNTLFLDSRATRSAVSAEWSRRVREGVAKLQPPGPRVYCASEED